MLLKDKIAIITTEMSELQKNYDIYSKCYHSSAMLTEYVRSMRSDQRMFFQDSLRLTPTELDILNTYHGYVILIWIMKIFGFLPQSAIDYQATLDVAKIGLK